VEEQKPEKEREIPPLAENSANAQRVTLGQVSVRSAPGIETKEKGTCSRFIFNHSFLFLACRS
jgi:hypothetical protein